MTAPLVALQKGKRKSQKISWSDEAEKTFSEVRQASLNFVRECTIQCDASDVGLGCVLSQVDENGAEVVIVYASRAFSEVERKYCATVKECLTVVFGVEKFRCYVDGVKLNVITDHHALVKSSQMRDPYGRLARWTMKLQEFDMVIENR